ncbi:Fasciclin domain-containing protein [Chitinophaga sp. CF118]|uniref:RagB/SusD family nutrient uptake outer membrane protein n=1 Tax=Chitinophaga sp. CF118 TaxID=1884367 RepID=UPI0008E80309|nr:RagB/SusD family nutrient uptake outer membrane protein [Chitinophaga sp. CF118]SFE41699.1 Fasciclin domain-containing protein [Chitinophaga sp. CF118]
MKKILFPLLVCGLFACSKKDNENSPSTQPEAVTEITTYLSGVDSLSQFGIALKKTTISATDAAGGLTVFATGDEAIGTYDIGAKTMGSDLPDSVVKSHIVKGVIKASDLTDGKILIALSGKELKVKVVDGHIYINGVLILFADGKAGKQIVHIIAKLLTTSPGKANITVYDATKWNTEHRSGVLLAGATVNLYLTSLEYQNHTPHYTATTDDNGIAHFTGITPASYFAVVTKGNLSNIWPDANGNTYVTTDTLFQSTAEISNAPMQLGAVPGDFRFTDLNQDGIVNANDKGTAPIREITIAYGETTTQKILIGYEVNHVMATIKTVDEAQTALINAAKTIGAQQKLLIMMDGMLSDEADCNGFPNWCTFDQFTFGASDNTIANIWKAEYSAIQQVNRIILSLSTMTGDTTNIAAQARALRAYAYLELATYFGGVPVNTELSMSPNISRSTLADTYQFIKKELNIALPALPAKVNSGDYRPMTSGAAKVFLARIALAGKDFVTAKSYADAIIQSGNYSLIDSIRIYEDPANTEVLWDLSYSLSGDFLQYFYRGTMIVNFCPAARYAEAYLIRAEADIELGNLGSAVEFINMLRIRAGRSTVGVSTADDARAELKIAYGIEFYREGFRFANLVRWNLASQILSNYGYKEYSKALPIPQTIIENYPNIGQNVGY